tara:strand:- start:272 stop:493 length:222 start_codon:yes stop_codon:yes gene_type:complete
MKHIMNLLSILAGKRFAKAYHLNPYGRQAKGWLNVYIGLRQQLPIIHLSHQTNHWGNHVGSGCKPYLATQGIK